MDDRQGKSGQRFEPAPQLVIADLDTLRVLADPMRMRIVEAFARAPDEPQTVKRVAATLGENVTRLYYHVNLLEQHGIIKVVESRVVSGIIEKRYQPAARGFTVDRSVLAARGDISLADTLGAAIGAILDSARDDIADGLREGRILPDESAPVHVRAVVAKSVGRMSPKRAASFQRRLRKLHEELDIDDDSPDAQPYALTVALYPARPTAAADPALPDETADVR